MSENAAVVGLCVRACARVRARNVFLLIYSSNCRTFPFFPTHPSSFLALGESECKIAS